jgi:two-component system, cell cycle response regulator
MKLLIADDDRVLTHLLSARLRAKGWSVTIALDAMQAMMFAMRTQPDAILLDIAMPGGTGVEALRKLKVSTRTSQIPVVILSGSAEPGDESAVRELGAAGFLKKPADIDDLHAMLLQVAHLDAPRANA